MAYFPFQLRLTSNSIIINLLKSNNIPWKGDTAVISWRTGSLCVCYLANTIIIIIQVADTCCLGYTINILIEMADIFYPRYTINILIQVANTCYIGYTINILIQMGDSCYSGYTIVIIDTSLKMQMSIICFPARISTIIPVALPCILGKGARLRICGWSQTYGCLDNSWFLFLVEQYVETIIEVQFVL